MRRFVAGCGALLIVLAAAAPALAACAGWAISPRDRHACCARFGDLASEGHITDCCAASEQSTVPADREHQVSSVIAPPALVARIPILPSAELHARSATGVPVEVVSPPKYVLLGSFLI